MPPDQIVRDLRVADAALRRFATHLVPGRADEALRRAYSTAITQQMPVLEGDRPSTRMFWEVRASSLALRTTSLASASTDSDLATALHGLPANERAALLLVGVEGLTVADAASVLTVSPERVVDLANGAGRSMRERVPAMAAADDATLVAAIRDLPIVPAPPPFWDGVEREAMSTVSAVPDASGISTWIWVAVGAVSVVVIAALALALSGDDGSDDETVAIDTSTTIEAAPTSTTVPLTTPTTDPGDGSTTTTVVSSTTTSVPATTTTAAATTTTAPPDTGPIDRGDVSFADGAASIDGTLEAQAERWQLAVGDGESLIVPNGVSGVDVLLLAGDGTSVSADAMTATMQVFESTGDRLLEVSAPGDGAVGYELDLGRSAAGTGWLSVAQAEGSPPAVGQLTALNTIECVAASGGVAAELEDAADDDQRIAIVADGAEGGAATWTGPVEAGGTVTSTSSTANGVVVEGTIDSGPDELLGRSFSVVVLGCDEA